MPLRIAIVVPGRFYAFDLAREMLRLGHEVTVFTNYPSFAAERFGIPRRHVRGFVIQGIGGRVLRRVFRRGLNGNVQRTTDGVFARWAAKEVTRHRWDAVIGFSGVSEETFRILDGDQALKVLVRASSHIRVQRRLLDEEHARARCWVERPSDWIVEREEREYELADAIHVLSDFCRRSFVNQGVDECKLFVLRLGVDTQRFRATSEAIDARCRRIMQGDPLRILNVGAFSRRKGMADFATAIESLDGEPFSFRFVGPIVSDARAVYAQIKRRATFVRKLPQDQLPDQYRWGDVFVLPTIEDGFPVVLTQALASGLPLITTPNSSGPDLIKEGVTGWVTPLRSPDALVDRLRWCHEHRDKLCGMVRQAYNSWSQLDWRETALQAERHLQVAIASKSESRDEWSTPSCERKTIDASRPV